ncbi:MAG: hypothetical protein ACFFC7_24705 [Candidatus Hermodarchaeota archaeon]
MTRINTKRVVRTRRTTPTKRVVATRRTINTRQQTSSRLVQSNTIGSWKDQINFIESNNIPYTDRGEFSEVWVYDQYVIKRNADVSKYNPKQYTRETMLKRSKEAMKQEYIAYQKLKKYKSMPRFMIQYEKDGRYYLIRESGSIPLAKGEEKKRSLARWQKGSVTQGNFQKFTNEMLLIAKKEGYFIDTLQPALRSNGSLFVTDLGLFVSKDSEVKNDRIVKRKGRFDEDYWLIISYREMIQDLKLVSRQLGLPLIIPPFVIEDHIRIYEKEYERKRKTRNEKYAYLTAGKYLEEWKKIKTKNGIIEV